MFSISKPNHILGLRHWRFHNYSNVLCCRPGEFLVVQQKPTASMMSIIPHEAFAEDQHYAKTILATHVLFRGFQMGLSLEWPTAELARCFLLAESEVRQPA